MNADELNQFKNRFVTLTANDINQLREMLSAEQLASLRLDDENRFENLPKYPFRIEDSHDYLILSLEEVYVKHLASEGDLYLDIEADEYNVPSLQDFKNRLQSGLFFDENGEMTWQHVTFHDENNTSCDLIYVAPIDYVRALVEQIQEQYYFGDREVKMSFDGFRDVDYQSENVVQHDWQARRDGSSDIIEVFEFDYESTGIPKPENSEYFGIRYTKYVRGFNHSIHIEDYEPLSSCEKVTIVIEKWEM